MREQELIVRQDARHNAVGAKRQRADFVFVGPQMKHEIVELARTNLR